MRYNQLVPIASSDHVVRLAMDPAEGLWLQPKWDTCADMKFLQHAVLQRICKMLKPQLRHIAVPC